MNPRMNVTSLERRVGSNTEDFFNSAFWSRLDVVITALDNVEARLYVDSKCVAFQKPMLESGTQGNKGNTQVTLGSIRHRSFNELACKGRCCVLTGGGAPDDGELRRIP